MKDQEIEILFELVRKSLFDIKPQPEKWGKDWSWAPILKVIEDNVMQAMMAESIVSLPTEMQPGEETTSVMMQRLALNMQEHVRLNIDLCQVFDMLEKNDYNPILMKGQGLADYYIKPMSRKCGDIDIYIGKEKYRQATDLLTKSLKGAELKEDKPKHTTIKWGKTEIELHQFAEILRKPQDNDAYQKIAEKWFANPGKTTIMGKEIKVPSIQSNPVYLFCHIWGHFMLGGIGLRQFCDLAVVLRKTAKEIDCKTLRDELEAIGLVEEWELTGCMLVKLMGLPSDCFPLYKKMERQKAFRFAELILKDGNFSKNRNLFAYSDNYIQHKLHSIYIHTRRALMLFKASPSLGWKTYKAMLSNGWEKIKEEN